MHVDKTYALITTKFNLKIRCLICFFFFFKGNIKKKRAETHRSKMSFQLIPNTSVSQMDASFVNVKDIGKFSGSLNKYPEERLNKSGVELGDNITSKEVKLLVNGANFDNEEEKPSDEGIVPNQKIKCLEPIDSFEEMPKISIKSTSATMDDSNVYCSDKIVSTLDTQNNGKNIKDGGSAENELLPFVKKEEDEEAEIEIEYVDLDENISVKDETLEGKL